MPDWLSFDAGIGVIWLLAPSIPWPAKLPGDISIERENFRFYFPVVTCMVFMCCLENAFWHFGGVPKTLVPDNLKAAMLKADW